MMDMMDKRYPYCLSLMSFGVVQGWAMRAGEQIRQEIDNKILRQVIRAARHSGPLNQKQETTIGDSKPCQ